MSKWEWKKLGDLYPIVMGKTPPRGDPSCWDKSKRTNNVWVTIADISSNENQVITESKEYISDKATKNISLVSPKSLLLSFKLSIGKMAFAGVPLYTNEAIVNFPPIKDIDLHYLHKYFLYYNWDKASEGDTKVKGKTLNKEKLKNIDIPIPPLSEQKRIVKFLDEEFSKIETLKTNAETNLKNAKVFFQKKIANEFTINAERLKQGWIETTVGDIADIKGGKRIPKGEKLLTKKTKHPYIRVTDFNDNGSVDLDDIHYISDEIYEGIKRYIITTEDAYVSIAGTIGKCGIIPLELNNANLTENACRLIFNTNIYNRFFVYFSLSDEFKALTQKETRANAMPKLSILRLSQIQIPLPPLSVQKEIVARLDKLSENVKRLEANYKQIIANCDELKKSILMKTFEGES